MANNSFIYKLRVFSLNDVIRHLGLTHSAASGALARWQAQGIVRMVRRNLYLVINPATDMPFADKYELSSYVTPSSYVGWHTALEFHGLAHQSFYNSFVGSERRFTSFHFEEIDYEYCASPFEASEQLGIIRPLGNPYVRVTDLERTIVDCCDRIDRAGGPEELLHCLEGASLLDENKLAKYLALYDKAFLYQKVGFILEQGKGFHHINDEFVSMCHVKGAVHTKRLTNGGDSNLFVSKWKLYVPQNCIIDNSSDYELI